MVTWYMLPNLIERLVCVILFDNIYHQVCLQHRAGGAGDTDGRCGHPDQGHRLQQGRVPGGLARPPDWQTQSRVRTLRQLRQRSGETTIKFTVILMLL